MQLYEALYYQLFAAIADAVEALDQMDFGRARQILIACQQKAEDRVLFQDEESSQ